MVITPGGAWESCELRKISNIELKFFTIKPIHQKQLPVVFCKKSILKNFGKENWREKTCVGYGHRCFPVNFA